MKASWTQDFEDTSISPNHIFLSICGNYIPNKDVMLDVKDSVGMGEKGRRDITITDEKTKSA